MPPKRARYLSSVRLSPYVTELVTFRVCNSWRWQITIALLEHFDILSGAGLNAFSNNFQGQNQLWKQSCISVDYYGIIRAWLEINQRLKMILLLITHVCCVGLGVPLWYKYRNPFVSTKMLSLFKYLK